MTTLHLFLLILFIFLCVLLIASVLLQSGKGGGMAGLGGGSSDTAFGAHTANVLQKFTMFCVISFFVLVVVLAHTLKGGNDGEKGALDNYKTSTTNPNPTGLPDSTNDNSGTVAPPPVTTQPLETGGTPLNTNDTPLAIPDLSPVGGNQN
jgi:preprotein translocase subunit SecG